jgi:ribonucrease Y
LYDLAERKGQELIEKAEKEIVHRHKKVDQMEEKINQKEERMDEKMEKLEEKKEEYITKKQELEKIVEQQKTILSDLSSMSPEQAKQELFAQIENDQKTEITRFVNKYKLIKEEEAKEEAAKIIARILPRVAQEGISEHLVTMVDLPSEDMK